MSGKLSYGPVCDRAFVQSRALTSNPLRITGPFPFREAHRMINRLWFELLTRVPDGKRFPLWWSRLLEWVCEHTTPRDGY